MIDIGVTCGRCGQMLEIDSDEYGRAIIRDGQWVSCTNYDCEAKNQIAVEDPEFDHYSEDNNICVEQCMCKHDGVPGECPECEESYLDGSMKIP